MRTLASILILMSLMNASLTAHGLINNCPSLLRKKVKQEANLFHQEQYAKIAIEIMMAGSLNLSRTKVYSKRPVILKQDAESRSESTVSDDQISIIAEANFKRAAEFVLENFDSLELNLETAIVLNRILTDGMMPPQISGKYDYRKSTSYAEAINEDVGRRPYDFYVKWLNSPKAKALFRKSPIEFAETVHHALGALDSFPDGNGRLSRLFADLALIKSNIAPVFYDSMADYFERGNAQSGSSHTVRKEYFNEAVLRGQAYIEMHIGSKVAG